MSAAPDPQILYSDQWRSQGLPDFTGPAFSDYFWMLGAKPNELAPWWSPKRDIELRRYSRTSLPSSILYGRITEIKNLGWTLVTDDKAEEANLDKYYKMFEESQLEEGFRTFLELYVKDRHTQDNGGFVELIAPGDPMQMRVPFYQEQPDGRKVPIETDVWAKPPITKEQIVGFAAMDAANCWRTFNREYPVVYRNPFDGRLHVFHRSRVVARAQFRDTLERSRGLGLCSLSRAYDALELARVNNRYVFEMMSGTQPRLAIARGIQAMAIDQALKDGEIQANNKGVYFYRGTAFVQGDGIPEIREAIEFYDLNHTPDGWDRETELTLALYMIAMAFGTEPRDLGWPATQTGATKADAESMEARTQGRGRADEISDIEEWMSSRLLPKGIRLEFDTVDDNEEHRKAEIARLRAESRQMQVMTGEIDRGEAREMAAREGDIPAEFLETRTIIQDDSNPTDNNENPADSQPEEREFTDDEDESEENEAQKGIAQTRRAMGEALTKLMKRGVNRKVRPIEFLNGTRAIMERDIDKAFRDGLRSGGKRNSDLLSVDQRRELQAYMKAQAPYYRALRDWVFTDPAPDETAIANRVQLWRNKGLEEAYMKGKLLGRPGQLYEYVLGKTSRHCPSCKAASKQVHSAAEWYKAGIYPRSSDLECGGFNCDCKFKKATKAQVVGNINDIPKRKGMKAVIDFAHLGDSHTHEAVTT